MSSHSQNDAWTMGDEIRFIADIGQRASLCELDDRLPMLKNYREALEKRKNWDRISSIQVFIVLDREIARESMEKWATERGVAA